MTPFRKFVFCTKDFYLANGIPKWIFLLHFEKHILSKGRPGETIFWYFLFTFYFFGFFRISFSHGMEFQNGFSFNTNLKLVKVSTDNKDELHILIALRSYDSVPQICILRNGFLSGERNSKMDFPFAWMSN